MEIIVSAPPRSPSTITPLCLESTPDSLSEHSHPQLVRSNSILDTTLISELFLLLFTSCPLPPWTAIKSPADTYLIPDHSPNISPTTSSNTSTSPFLLHYILSFSMGTKGREVPRVVCCAIPITSAARKVLVITSRKRQDLWVLPKGGWESTDGVLEAAASREALEEAGVRGRITRYVTTIQSPSTTYHFYELEVSSLDKEWLEGKERTREWVDYAEAYRRIAWKPELAQGLSLSTLAPRR